MGNILKSEKQIELLLNKPLEPRSYYSDYSSANDFAEHSQYAYDGQIISVRMSNDTIQVYALQSRKDLPGFDIVPVGDHISFKYVDEFPLEFIEDVIYIKNGIGYIYVNGLWKELLYEKTDIVNKENPSKNKITSEFAVHECVNHYINEVTNGASSTYVKNITFDPVTGKLILLNTFNEPVQEIILNNFIYDFEYIEDTRTFMMKRSNNTPISIELGKDTFIDPTKPNKYNAVTGDIELYLNNGNVIKIPAKELVDIYTGSESDTVSLNIDSTNNIKADIKISAKENNILRTLINQTNPNENGLFVEDPDIITKMSECIVTCNNYTDTMKDSIGVIISNLNDEVNKKFASTSSELKRYTDLAIKDNAQQINISKLIIPNITYNTKKGFMAVGSEQQSVLTTAIGTNDIIHIQINGLAVNPDQIQSGTTIGDIRLKGYRKNKNLSLTIEILKVSKPDTVVI